MSENENGAEEEGKSVQKEDLGSLEEIISELRKDLETEKAKSSAQEKKIQYLLADFENLKKRAELDVQGRVDSITDGMILKFLSLYDDFARARDALSKQNVNTDGLDAILKNMDSFLTEYGVRPIDALGEVFDPTRHEAISVRADPALDDDTITAELRKGYILKDRIIRPSLVEISKKQIEEMN
ncbi:MAG: nucleotide exchange factor GrpE [Thaumarchaeota archaeon]|nr:nucleotide exchange factor GrpE [Nitrososphaerota archaeon]